MSSRSALAGLAWWGINIAEYRRYRVALRDPKHAQERVLRKYLRENADTIFGRDFNFGSIRSPQEFQARVPLAEYEDFLPYVTRIANGEPGVLTRSPVKLLELTSGSTTAAKYVPYTAVLQREFSRAVAAWIVDLYRRDPNLAWGPSYWSITPVAQEERRSAGGLPIGFEEDSAYLGGMQKWLVDALMAVPGEVRHVQDIGSFRYVTLLFLLRCRDLRLISIWHPSFLTLLLESLRRFWKQLLQDIADGTLSPPRDLSAELQARLRAILSPYPRRAAELRELGPIEYARIWPKLGLISCWGDGHSTIHLDALRPTFPRVKIQPKGLISTEAFVTLPFAGRWPVAVRSHYFEFLDDDGTAHLAYELEPGGEYSIVVTTGGGFYRYRLKDRVRVVGRCEQTPSLRFLGRQDLVSDRFGEKLSEGFVSGVLQRLFSQFDLQVRFAMLAPEETAGRTCYALYLQLDTELPDHFCTALRRLLRDNPHYRYCVDLGQLRPAQIFLVSNSAYEAYGRTCRERGQRLGDVKPSSLSTTCGWSQVFDGGLV